MASVVLTSLSLTLVVVGLTLLITGITLSRRAQRYRKGLQALLQLGSQNGEPLALPEAAWPVLTSAGWQHLVLTGDWFGQAVRSELGIGTGALTTPGKSSTLVYPITSADDVSLTLTLTHGERRGDAWLFAEQLAQVLALLIETSLRTRTEAISSALAERARLTLYLQHDMRNLAQWVEWVCADFATCSDAQTLLVAAHRLQENAALAQERARRLIAALGQKHVTENPALVDLGVAITQAAHLAGIEVDLTGQAQAWIAPELLARVLDNLLSNLAPNWREPLLGKPTLQLQTTPATGSTVAMAQIQFFSPWQKTGAQMAAEKLFEPFVSGRPGGLGLGLYQARKSLREAGGELRATATDGGVNFLLRIPSKTA